MKLLFPAILQALAFGVAFAEVVIPSFGVLAMLSAGLLIWSWFHIVDLGGRWPLWFGLADLVLIPVAIKMAFSYLGKSPASHRTDLGTGSGLEALDQTLGRHVGSVVVVEADLRPTGKIRVGEEIYEAQTAGEWVPRGASVRVVSVSGSRFQVEKAAAGAAETAPPA